MLPNYLIIGVQKAATTWLAQCLGQHPDVFMAETKEVYFFHGQFEKGLEWYESHFNASSGEKAVGEATPGYIYFPEAPGRIKDTLGDKLKLIANLRHPVDRAYSAFWMFQSRGSIPADADFRTCFCQDRNGLQSRGHYFAQLSRYLELFHRENLLIHIYEDIKRDSLKTVRDSLEFLGVNPQFVPSERSARAANRGINMSVFHHQVWGLRRAIKSLPSSIEKPLAAVGRRIFDKLPTRKNYMPLDPNLRQELLNDSFVSDIKRLESLLDRDLSIWYAPPSG